MAQLRGLWESIKLEIIRVREAERTQRSGVLPAADQRTRRRRTYWWQGGGRRAHTGETGRCAR